MTYSILIFAGWVNSISLAWPFEFVFAHGQPVAWLQLSSMSCLCWAISKSQKRSEAAKFGQVFATSWLIGCFWWLYVSLHTFGELNALLAGSAVFALAALLAIYYAIATAAAWQLGRNSVPQGVFVFAALWTAAELARGTWLTGFGWGAIGYTHTDGFLAWYAPWIGSYGVGALAAALPMLFITGLMKRKWSASVSILGILVVPTLLPAKYNEWTTSNGSVAITLLQGNIPQNDKFNYGVGIPLALGWYGDQLKSARTPIVVAPETAIPLLPNQLPVGYWTGLTQHFNRASQLALIGIPLGGYGAGYTNSVVGLAGGEVAQWQYDKHHLVPFGEFVPPLFRWFTQMMNIPLGDFNRGILAQPSYAAFGQRLGLNICYEDLFGEELGARFIESNLAPTIFINVSNIGWFGNTIAIDQHLQISRMRALETQRPFARSTNTGATAFIDHTGNVISQLPRHTRGTLEGALEGREGITPYAWWVSRFGLWPFWITIFGIVLCAVRRTKFTQKVLPLK